MRPGAWDTAGFLGPGDSLPEVLDNDRRTLAAEGTNAATLGRRLAELLAAAGESDVRRPLRLDLVDVELHRQRGMITCPWASDEFERCEIGQGSPPTASRFMIRHRPSHTVLQGFELSAHLIRDHGFFGGPNTRFRIEPTELTLVLSGAK
jgi:hypothetical protein